MSEQKHDCNFSVSNQVGLGIIIIGIVILLGWTEHRVTTLELQRPQQNTVHVWDTIPVIRWGIDTNADGVPELFLDSLTVTEKKP
jgi:hypothetical protein